MMTRNTLAMVSLLAVSACGNTLDRLEAVGKEPAVSKIENPTQKEDYQPVSWPMPEPKAQSKGSANSLWQPGSRAFFRDQRARNVGDILTVMVAIDDEAKLDNSTERKRTSSESMGAPAIFGLEDNIIGAISGQANADSLLSLEGDSNNSGEGKIDRKEKIETAVAAMVTQILPNGNLVVSGRQQIRVNYELREITVDGVIRPEDISNENKIASEKIAEARITYGGRGTVSDVQQPRIGSQVIDILSPF